MKYTKLLFLPALTLTLSMAASNSEISVRILTADIYGPFTSEENCYFAFTSTKGKQVIQGYIKGYKNNNYVFNREFEIVNGSSEEINIPTKNRISTSGLRLDMTFKDNADILKEYSVTLYPPLETTVIANKQKVSYGGSIFGLSVTGLVDQEEYDFKDTNEYYSLEEGGKIDISGVSFGYYPSGKYYCSNAYLEILDKKQIFSLVNKDENGYVRFPLKSTVKNRCVCFDFDINMYVNYETMEMSQVMRDGFSETDSLYLPLGKERLLEEETSRIVIEGSGFNRNTVIIPLSFYLSTRLFGSCDDSDYCIHGGIRE